MKRMVTLQRGSFVGLTTLLLFFSTAWGQQTTLIEDKSLDSNAPDPTKEQIIAPVETNMIAFPDSCPEGFEELPGQAPLPSEVQRFASQPHTQLVVCQETMETIAAREAERAKSPPQLPPGFEARSFSSKPRQEQLPPPPPSPQLPPGVIAGPACPAGFEEIPDGAKLYGIKLPQPSGFEPVPVVVCHEKTSKN